jgi:hypothetical protein
MPQKLYVPILWAKEGELGALKQLPADVRDQLVPFFEVPPLPWDHANDRPAKTLDQHLEKLLTKIAKAWGNQDRAFIDLEWIPSADRMHDGSHPIASVFDVARKYNLQLVPVLSLTRDSEYVSAVASVIKKDNRGVCLRMLIDDLDESDVAALSRDFLGRVGNNIAETDLILDVKDLRGARLEQVVRDLPSLIGRIPSIQKWRSFALAGTGFPDSLAGLPKLKMSRIKRTEWELWRAISARQLVRQPTFSDYGIGSPAYPDVDPRVMSPSAAIRYTASGDWLIAKGNNLKNHGYEQFHGVCRALVQSKAYTGRAFSWGDTYIHDCARNETGTGNLTTWRKVGTSHHLTFVVKQLASGF